MQSIFTVPDFHLILASNIILIPWIGNKAYISAAVLGQASVVFSSFCFCMQGLMVALPGGLWVSNLTWLFERKSFNSSSVLEGFLKFSPFTHLPGVLFSTPLIQTLYGIPVADSHIYTIITRFSVFSNTIFINHFTHPDVFIVPDNQPPILTIRDNGARLYVSGLRPISEILNN